MSTAEYRSRHLWCEHCARGRVEYIEVMTRANRMTLRGGLLRRTVRCNLCLVVAEQGTFALGVTFFDCEDEYEPWEGEYLDLTFLSPVEPRAL